jgi:hypothetical protein
MELIQAYLYRHPPFRLKGIDMNLTEMKLKVLDFYEVQRSTTKFAIYSKHYQIDDQDYRVIIRFTRDFDSIHFYLNQPVPYVIFKCATNAEGVSIDTKSYHGKSLKNVSGYVSAGVDIRLFQRVYSDLSHALFYD